MVVLRSVGFVMTPRAVKDPSTPSQPPTLSELGHAGYSGWPHVANARGQRVPVPMQCLSLKALVLPRAHHEPSELRSLMRPETDEHFGRAVRMFKGNRAQFCSTVRHWFFAHCTSLNVSLSRMTIPQSIFHVDVRTETCHYRDVGVSTQIEDEHKVVSEETPVQ